jgi:hypothetical protein
MPGTSGGDNIGGTRFTDIIDPLAGNDTLIGYGGSDVIFASPGDDMIHGHFADYFGAEGGAADFTGHVQGVDTVVYASARADVVLTPVDLAGYWGHTDLTTTKGWQTTSSLEGKETLHEVSRLVFADNEAIALDIGGPPGSWSPTARAVKLLAAIFGPESLDNEQGVGQALSLIDGGMSDEAFAALALGYLGLSEPEDVVSLVWSNVAEAPMDDYYRDLIVELFESGMTTSEFVVLASDSPYNTDKIKLTGVPDGESLASTGLAYRHYPAPSSTTASVTINGTTIGNISTIGDVSIAGSLSIIGDIAIAGTLVVVGGHISIIGNITNAGNISTIGQASTSGAISATGNITAIGQSSTIWGITIESISPTSWLAGSLTYLPAESTLVIAPAPGTLAQFVGVDAELQVFDLFLGAGP